MRFQSLQAGFKSYKWVGWCTTSQHSRRERRGTARQMFRSFVARVGKACYLPAQVLITDLAVAVGQMEILLILVRGGGACQQR